jgi:hypothetical protein
VQICDSTWTPRNTRHDSLVKYTTEQLEKLGYRTVTEPRIATPAGIRKPDLVAWKPGLPAAYVIDVSIIADCVDLDRDHELKCEYYDTPAIRAYVGFLTDLNPEQVQFSALIINWRGAMSPHSSGDLTALGISKRIQEIMVVKILEKGYDIYTAFKRTTSRHCNPRAGPRVGVDVRAAPLFGSQRVMST